MAIKLVLLPPAKQWFMFPGTFRAKTPFLGDFLMFVQNVLKCLYGGFMVLNSNLYIPIHETSSFSRLERMQRPHGLKMGGDTKFELSCAELSPKIQFYKLYIIFHCFLF